MTYREVKKELLRRLKDGVLQCDDLPPRYAVRALMGYVASHDKAVKWPAVSALGQCAARMADQSLEAGREVLRRIVWGLNEESGAVGLGLPEAMGEILARHAGLRSEFLNLLVNYLCPGHCYLEFPPLHQGVIWALGRVAQSDRQALIERGALELLPPHLDSPDPQTRGLALWALSTMGYNLNTKIKQALRHDQERFNLYQNNCLSVYAIKDLA